MRANVNSTALSVPCKEGACHTTEDDPPVGYEWERMHPSVSLDRHHERRMARFCGGLRLPVRGCYETLR